MASTRGLQGSDERGGLGDRAPPLAMGEAKDRGWAIRTAIQCAICVGGAYAVYRVCARRKLGVASPASRKKRAKNPTPTLPKMPPLFHTGCGMKIRRLIDRAEESDVVGRLLGCVESENTGACHWVDTLDTLEALRESLKEEREIVLDVEHHSYYSFHGVVCLLQIGVPAKGETYLVDAIALRKHVGRCLHTVLESDRILKVVHGAGNDVLWLQRDFSIFLVNIFDTEQASKTLGREKSSLASLMKDHFGFEKATKYQKADWRTRPLSREMIDYATKDVSYLHKIKNILVRDLMKVGKVVIAFQRSQKVTLRAYKEQRRTPTDLAISMLKKGKRKGRVRKGKVNPSVLISVCRWRNDVAESEDVSLQAMMPDFVALWICSKPPPTTLSDLLSDLTKAVEAYDSPYVNKATFLETITPHLGTLTQALMGVYKKVESAGEARGDGKKQQDKDGQRQLKRERHIERFSRKSPAYDDYKMLSSSGEVLCFCDRKKARWYLDKGLAKEVVGGSEPSSDKSSSLVIQLLFEHRQSDQRDVNGKFYMSSKGNHCVGCGIAKNYLRYRLVPTCYRQNFPEKLKSHRSHDIVLLCVDCHEVAAKAASALIKAISAETSVPLNIHRLSGKEGSHVHFEWNKQPVYKNAYKAAMALVAHGDTMPETRIAELKGTIAKAFEGLAEGDSSGEEEVDTLRVVQVLAMSSSRSSRKAIKALLSRETPKAAQEIREWMEANATKKNHKINGHYMHGKMVVEKLVKEGGDTALVDLVVRLRQSFLQSVNPKFLPESWSVDHALEREFGQHSVYNERTSEEGPPPLPL